MPRVKLVWHGVAEGEWQPATGELGKCKHPREMLRFDGSFAAPSYMYCRACGKRYLSPWHGMTQKEIDDARTRGEEMARKLLGPVCPECEIAHMGRDDHVWICPRCNYETSEPFDDEDLD